MNETLAHNIPWRPKRTRLVGDTQEKYCIKCEEWKPLIEYNTRWTSVERTARGPQPYCRKCQNGMSKQRRHLRKDDGNTI